MKNFILTFLFIAVCSALLQFFFPWWSVAPVAFLAGWFFVQRSHFAFTAGFVSVFILWVVFAYILSSANEHLLATKVASLLYLKGNVYGLMFLTGTIGGLVGGFAALSGSLLQKVNMKS